MINPTRHCVLLVDDEPHVLEGLALHLRRQYDIVTASNGTAGLAAMHTQPTPSVVISDMRMPGIDGATFLASVRGVFPLTVRILLTGQGSLATAISAINDGQVFRFLSKPCPPAILQSTVASAIHQHELLTAERVLLSKTLHGSVEALLEVLSLTNPLSFSWSQRLKRLVGDVSDVLRYDERWLVEIAAMFSQIGSVTLPSSVSEKVYRGRPLTADESAMVAKVPATTDQLLAHIPRLEEVRIMLLRAAQAETHVTPPRDPVRPALRTGIDILSASMQYLRLDAMGVAPPQIIQRLRADGHHYESELCDALASLHTRETTQRTEDRVSLAGLRAGMVLADDLCLTHGPILAVRGYVVTDSFVHRCLNIRDGAIAEPIRVVRR